MVVDAAGDDVPAGEATEEPTEEELDSLAKKLNGLHDELPGNQHLVLDALVGKTLLKEAADVEGYHWLFIRTVPPRRIPAWRQYCKSMGGDRFVRIWTRRAYPKVGCWHND
jgi:hypothetical protein